MMLSNQKKLLIAGGGYADIPLILAAKSLGFYVITSGNRKADIGHRHSDEFCLEDFSNKDAMLNLAQRLEIDAICASCNDFSAITSAYIAEKMGLPGHDSYETTLLIHHKDQYRKFAQKHNIPSPLAEGFTSVKDALANLINFQLPIIIKPVDLTGGKGVSKITNIEDAQEKLEKAFDFSRAKRVIIEEFLEGSRHGLSTFIRDGRVVFHFNDNEHYYLNPYLVSAASIPSIVPSEAVNSLCKTAEKIASLLNLKTGIFHIQYILRQGEPVIIEICRRAPGDLYIKFVQVATGIDYPSFIVKAASGMNCNDLIQVQPKGYFTRHCMMTSRNGKLKNISISPSVELNIIDQLIWWQKGEEVRDFLTHKFGIVFLQFSSVEEMLHKTEAMQNLIYAEMI